MLMVANERVRFRFVAVASICRCKGGSLCWPIPPTRRPSVRRQSIGHASLCSPENDWDFVSCNKYWIRKYMILSSEMLINDFSLTKAERRVPSWEKTVKLKLLWLSAIVTSPSALIPTPIG